jgi:hypothetical protein
MSRFLANCAETLLVAAVLWWSEGDVGRVVFGFAALSATCLLLAAVRHEQRLNNERRRNDMPRIFAIAMLLLMTGAGLASAQVTVSPPPPQFTPPGFFTPPMLPGPPSTAFPGSPYPPPVVTPPNPGPLKATTQGGAKGGAKGGADCVDLNHDLECD